MDPAPDRMSGSSAFAGLTRVMGGRRGSGSEPLESSDDGSGPPPRPGPPADRTPSQGKEPAHGGEDPKEEEQEERHQPPRRAAHDPCALGDGGEVADGPPDDRLGGDRGLGGEEASYRPPTGLEEPEGPGYDEDWEGADSFNTAPDLRRLHVGGSVQPGSGGSSGSHPALMRSFLISSELRLHEQITSDGGLEIDFDTVQQMEQEMEVEGMFRDHDHHEVLSVGVDKVGASLRLPRTHDAFASYPPMHLRSGLGLPRVEGQGGAAEEDPVQSFPSAPGTGAERQPKSIVFLVVGTRGDIQPFIGIALRLKEYGHRVRIATHKDYQKWILENGFEYFPLGGDPRVLSEFVCKHRGVVPKMDTSSIKDVMAQSLQVDAIINSTYPAVCGPDPETGATFHPDLIVANPPAFGHTHCAEKLGVPLHVVFTMPWTPTKYFPQPFARTRINMDQDGHPDGAIRKAVNWYSYFGVDKLQWLGMSSMIAKFRKEVLGFTGPMRKEHAAHALYYSKVPFTYIWSPSLADRPADWPPYCKVVGFINLDLKKLDKGFEPPEDLQRFLEAGEPPVYIGFGSLVVDDPDRLTKYFVDAAKATGLRALIQKGWGGLGANLKTTPDGVYLIDKPIPHDWLFTKVCAVVHHGGAGTTAMGLYSGKPTFIVPFFGDQPFWGAACHKAGVGPAPVNIDDLTLKVVIDAFKTLICPACQKAAQAIKLRMLAEDGVQSTVDHIHETLDAWAEAAATGLVSGPPPADTERKGSRASISSPISPFNA